MELVAKEVSLTSCPKEFVTACLASMFFNLCVGWRRGVFEQSSECQADLSDTEPSAVEFIRGLRSRDRQIEREGF